MTQRSYKRKENIDVETREVVFLALGNRFKKKNILLILVANTHEMP